MANKYLMQTSPQYPTQYIYMTTTLNTSTLISPNLQTMIAVLPMNR